MNAVFILRDMGLSVKTTVGTVGTVGCLTGAMASSIQTTVGEPLVTVGSETRHEGEPTVNQQNQRLPTVTVGSKSVGAVSQPTVPTVPTVVSGNNPEFDFNDPAFPDEDEVRI